MFREAASGSGLLVPEDLSRKRIVVTHGDWKVIDKALGILNRLGLRFQFRCEKAGCGHIERLRAPDGGTILRCDHADRVFSKSF